MKTNILSVIATLLILTAVIGLSVNVFGDNQAQTNEFPWQLGNAIGTDGTPWVDLAATGNPWVESADADGSPWIDSPIAGTPWADAPNA